MAYIDGESLDRKIESAPLGVEEAVDIALQVGDGQLHLWRVGVSGLDQGPGGKSGKGQLLTRYILPGVGDTIGRPGAVWCLTCQ